MKVQDKAVTVRVFDLTELSEHELEVIHRSLESMAIRRSSDTPLIRTVRKLKADIGKVLFKSVNDVELEEEEDEQEGPFKQ